MFLRHGNFWYRNPEFGKEVSDPDKRGRYGRQNKEGFSFKEFNPYHYHGEGHIGVNEKIGASTGNTAGNVNTRRKLRNNRR